MATATQTLVGVFKDYSTAHEVAEELMKEGFSPSEVHVSSQGGQVTAPATHHEGGISGWFHRVFGGDTSGEDYSGYESAVGQGGTVVAVDTDESKSARVIDIMESHGSTNIDHRAADSTQTMGAKPTAGSARNLGQTGDVIPVVEEELQVGKREVQRGGVRVISRVTERPVEEQIRLREEHARVERRPVDRPATEADLRSGDRVMEVREMAEEAVVAKNARVVEEVVVGKDATERTQTIRDSVRRTDVDVQNLPEEVRNDFQRDYSTRYPDQANAATYQDYGPDYEYGYRMAGDPRYQGKNWSDVESDLRSDYSQTRPGSTWDKVSSSVRYGWNKVTGKR